MTIMRQFSPEQRRRIIDLYAGGCNIKTVAEIMRCRALLISKFLREEGVTVRDPNAVVNDPTPEEIEAEAAKIRKSWEGNPTRKGEGEYSVRMPKIVSCDNLVARRGY
jgi:transposase-like protein